MSQEKMEAYKAAKQNKEQIRKENKRKKIVTKTIWSVVGVLFVALIAFLIVISVRNIEENKIANSGTPAGFGMDFMNAYVPVLDEADQYQVADAETEVAETEVAETEVAETETVAQ